MPCETASSESAHDLESNGTVTKPAKKYSILPALLWKLLTYRPETRASEAEKAKGFKNHPELRARRLQCCFVSIEDNKGSRAIKVPCLRPTKYRQVFKQHIDAKTGKVLDEKYRKMKEGESGVECDAAIFSRMRARLYRNLGAWKVRLPYYGILDAYEIEFQFDGRTTQDGRAYTIHHEEKLDLEHRKLQLDAMIAQELVLDELDFEGPCEVDFHRSACPFSMDGSPCPTLVARHARRKREQLVFQPMFKACLERPWHERHYNLFQGIVHDNSMIYNNEDIKLMFSSMNKKGACLSEKVRGIKVVMGWKYDLVIHELCKPLAWLCLSLLVIWLGIVVWVEKFKDWSTAMAFGQVIAACISLVPLYMRH